MNKRRAERDRVREEFWRAAVRRRESEGLTVREFCRRQRLQESTYHFWRRELKRRDAEAAASSQGQQTVEFGRAKRNKSAAVSVDRLGPRPPMRARPMAQRTAHFVPVIVAAGDGAGPVAEIVLPGACMVRVTRGCDSETLRMVLAVLSCLPGGASGEERPC